MRAFLSLLLTLTMGLPLTACSSDGVISSRLPSEGTAPVEKAPAETIQLIGDTAATAAADPSNQQILYLWEEGAVPTITEYAEDPSGRYFEDPDFRPYLISFPVPVGTKIKGAVLICAVELSNTAAMKMRVHRWPGPSAGWATRALWSTTVCVPIPKRKERLI